MLPLRRTALTAARRGRTTLPRQQRRNAHHDPEHSMGHSTEPAQPVSEPMGSAFWMAFGSIPAAYLIYQWVHSDEKNPSWLTRVIDKYTEKQEINLKRTALAMSMKEQAGRDRVLFLNTAPVPYVDMKFPEIMNNGSPYNVPAGSQVNMDAVIAKFKREHAEANERKHEQLRNGTVPSEQLPDESFMRYRGVELDRAIR